MKKNFAGKFCRGLGSLVRPQVWRNFLISDVASKVGEPLPTVHVYKRMLNVIAIEASLFLTCPYLYMAY